jgi:hypothetical protein
MTMTGRARPSDNDDHRAPVDMEPYRICATAILRAFKEDRFIFGYSGHFGDELSAQLLDLSDGIIAALSGEKAHRKRLAFLLVEAYQNIIRHRAGLPDHIERGEGRSFFTFRADPESQSMVAINGVYKHAVEDICRHLEAVRGLDHAELKSLSMRMLERQSESRGAGVGFIEMARRSGNDLGHMMRGLGPEHDLFALAVWCGVGHDHERILRDAATLHGTVVMNDILVFHAGVLTQAVSEVVAGIIGQAAPDTDTTLAVTSYRRWVAGVLNSAPTVRSTFLLARTPKGLVMVKGFTPSGQPPDRGQKDTLPWLSEGSHHGQGSVTEEVFVDGDGPDRVVLLSALV